MCGLVQIWQFADQGRTGFLSRVEFYNALKLVTVAQTGREITPELVRAALTGPAAAQIPPPRISSPAGPAGGASGGAAAGSQGPGPVQGAGAPAAQGLANGQDGQARSVQGSNGGASGRPASTQGNGLAGSQGALGGAPAAKQFSPHTNSAPSAPMAQGGYGGAAKQLAPQTNSLSAGGSGVPQLTSQTSSLSRYPPSAGQVQVAPTGFSQQGWARPPAAGGQPVRPSLGSLFTTNSAWPAKESNPASGTSQGAGSSGGGSMGPGPVLVTPSSGQSRSVTPASSGPVMASNANAGGGSAATVEGAGPAAVVAPSSAKEGVAGAGFNGGMELFSGGFKASGASGVGSGPVGSGAGASTVSGSQGVKAASVPGLGQSKAGGGGGVKQLEESMFSAPAVPSMQIAAQGGGRGPGGGASAQGRGPSGSGAMGMVAGSGAMAQGGPGMGASWPQMSGNDVERYSRVFTKVDTDKDGKITGEQARELFLSWQLPRGSVDACVVSGEVQIGVDG